MPFYLLPLIERSRIAALRAAGCSGEADEVLRLARTAESLDEVEGGRVMRARMYQPRFALSR